MSILLPKLLFCILLNTLFPITMGVQSHTEHQELISWSLPRLPPKMTTVARGPWVLDSLAPYEIPSSGFPPYGVPSGTASAGHIPFPTYAERATLVWYNMVRIDPVLYRNKWIQPNMVSGDNSWSNVFATSAYSSQPPIKWNLNLARAARAHSTDRQTCDPNAGGTGTPQCSGESPHMDCNGTTFCDRIETFYTPINVFGEIFWDFPGWALDGATQTGQVDIVWPFYGVAGWICDGPMFNNGQLSQCSQDDSANDGHRDNIMTVPTGPNGEVGCGQVFQLDNVNQGEPRMISTCDMSAQASPVYGSLTIASGAHVLHPFDNSIYFFAANWYHASATLVQAVVNVDGTDYDLGVLSVAGGPTANINPGTYTSDMFFYMTDTEPCHVYYFRFSTVDTTEIYPFTGAFRTHGIGACTTDWASTGGVNNTSGGGSNSSSSTGGSGSPPVWSGFTPCSTTCGGGIQSRQCIPHVQGGSLCSVGASQQACNTQECPSISEAYHVNWSAQSRWYYCSLLTCLVLLFWMN